MVREELAAPLPSHPPAWIRRSAETDPAGSRSGAPAGHAKVVYQNSGFTPAWGVSEWWLARTRCRDRRSA